MTKAHSVNTRISVVVPVLNEADGIPQLRCKLGRVQSVLAEFGDTEFVFVDDGSTDATLPLLRKAFPEGELCRILSHGRNRGVGAAFRTGFQQASGNIVCTIDADCSYEPEGLKRLVEEMIEAKADVAVASPISAFRTGFQQASGNIVCTIDADCSYEPEGLKRLVEEMIEAKADVAVASP